jgi:hypothetical protein
MHLKLTQPGYESMTGTLGAVEFENGLSVYGVSPQQADGILLVVAGEMTDKNGDVPLPAPIDEQ